MTEKFAPQRTLNSTNSVFTGRPKHPIDLALATKHVAATTGKSALRQRLEQITARLGPAQITRQEYYYFGLHRAEFTASDRQFFVGESSYRTLNKYLSPAQADHHSRLLHDKMLFTLLLDRCGFPAPKTQALFSKTRRVQGVRALTSADDIAHFIRHDANFPLFGKPDGLAHAIGTLSIIGLDNNGNQARLGNDETVTLTDLAQAIADTFGQAYLFQDHLDQHPIAAAACGTAIGALRILTLMLPNGPQPLYALQRIPGENAMSDAAHVKSRQSAEIDITSGRVVQHFQSDRTFGQSVDVARYANVPYRGQHLPFWPEILGMLTRAHQMFPTNGCIGWDVALTKTGPIIVEASAKPFQLAWQTASGRGLLTPAFADKFQQAIRHSNRKIPRIGLEKIRYTRFLRHLSAQSNA